ncbi:MAG: prolipoprotein diacylglyceryl transferase [Blastocatellia bacterium]|nr:prolipoprotein diacylglyceryl transferase [Blastocatellia bacterium]
MNNTLFLAGLSAIIAAFFAWAFRALPDERWQIIATMPEAKTEAGHWHGTNLTFYGFFMAAGNATAMTILLLLLGAIGVPAASVFLLAIGLFGLCWPTSRFIARAVEKKAYTFTIGGASFVGALLTPWLIELMNAGLGDRLGGRIPVIPAFAAGAIAYAFGEGIGRLACISFGCCYGKRIDALSPRLRGLFERISFTFTGTTKKAAYEGGLEGVRVVPIQAITAIVLSGIAIGGAWLFLHSRFTAALVFTAVATQLWRFASEMVRADVRGEVRAGGSQRISAYQAMALLMAAYVILIAAVLPSPAALTADISTGILALWNPAALLFIQALWLAIFVYTGRSKVTGATLSFFVHQDRI